MKPDSFRSQVQTVLTSNSEDIRHQGDQGASCCPTTKVVKRKFEDQEDTRTTHDEDAAVDASAATATPATLPHGVAAAGGGGVVPPALPVALPPAQGARELRESGRQGVVGRMLGPKADADSDYTSVLELE
jgi:hypothetical protein